MSEPADDPFASRRNHGVVAEIFSLVHVGDVHFDDGEVDGAYGIVQGYGRVGIGPGVEHHAVDMFVHGSLKAVDEFALLVVHGVAGGIIVLFVGIQIAAEEILTAVSGKADGISVAVNIILVD